MTPIVQAALAKYGPPLARALAAAIVGALGAGLAHYHLGALPADDAGALQGGLILAFLAILAWAFRDHSVLADKADRADHIIQTIEEATQLGVTLQADMPDGTKRAVAAKRL